MNVQIILNAKRKRRAKRVRMSFYGTANCPRLSVHRSLRFCSVQLIDDTLGRTIAAANDRILQGRKTDRAREVGKQIAELAKKIGITKVVFDRGAYRYHGRVKAMADGAREGGLTF